MTRFILIAVLFCVVAFPAQATPAEDVPSDTTLRQAVTAVFEEARLTARLEFDTYRWGQEVPLIEDATYQDRPLDGRLEPATLYLAGLEAGAGFRGARFFGWFRLNLGNKGVSVLPSGTTAPRFENGEVAGNPLATPEIRAYGMRMEYAPTVWKRLAFGGGLSYRHRGEYLTVDPSWCAAQPGLACSVAFSASTKTELGILYVPLRYHFGWGTLRARVGGSLWGSHSTLYEPSLAYDDPTPGPDEPPPAPGNLTKQEWEFEGTDPRAWFAEVGVDVPIHSFMIRPSLRVKRLQLEGAYTETVGGLKLQVGLPF